MARDPLLLALESSTRWISVALLRGEACLAAHREHGKAGGAERLLPLVHELLEEADVAVAEVESYAVSAGPGSFTGLRVAVATAKGLAFGQGAVVAPVSTLDALIHGAACRDGIAVGALDAHRGELYACARRFRGGAVAEEVMPARVVLPEELQALLEQAVSRDPIREIRWLGDAPEAAEGLGPRIARVRGGAEVRVLPPPEGAPHAVWIGELGLARLRAGEGVSPERIAPWYLRRAEAEVRRTGEAFEEPQNDV